MKRYNIVQKGHLFEVPWIVQESPTGEWVKYESWMDEAEKEHKHELTIDDLPKPKMPISEPGGYVVKDPTICTKCKNCIREIPSSRMAIATLLPSDVWHKCMVPAFDYVSGEKGYFHCIIKNHGNCPDYEPKEE